MPKALRLKTQKLFVSSRLDFCLEDLSSTLESFEQKMHGDFCPNSGNKITKHEGDLEYSVRSNGLLP